MAKTGRLPHDLALAVITPSAFVKQRSAPGRVKLKHPAARSRPLVQKPQVDRMHRSSDSIVLSGDRGRHLSKYSRTLCAGAGHPDRTGNSASGTAELEEPTDAGIKWHHLRQDTDKLLPQSAQSGRDKLPGIRVKFARVNVGISVILFDHSSSATTSGASVGGLHLGC